MPKSPRPFTAKPFDVEYSASSSLLRLRSCKNWSSSSDEKQLPRRRKLRYTMWVWGRLLQLSFFVSIVFCSCFFIFTVGNLLQSWKTLKVISLIQRERRKVANFKISGATLVRKLSRRMSLVNNYSVISYKNYLSSNKWSKV